MTDTPSTFYPKSILQVSYNRFTWYVNLRYMAPIAAWVGAALVASTAAARPLASLDVTTVPRSPPTSSVPTIDGTGQQVAGLRCD